MRTTENTKRDWTSTIYVASMVKPSKYNICFKKDRSTHFPILRWLSWNNNIFKCKNSRLYDFKHCHFYIVLNIINICKFWKLDSFFGTVCLYIMCLCGRIHMNDILPFLPKWDSKLKSSGNCWKWMLIFLPFMQQLGILQIYWRMKLHLRWVKCKMLMLFLL